MATATILTNVSPELARLRAEINRRGTKVYRIAKQLDALKGNPDYIYKILNGSRRMPDNFIEHFCGLACIPLAAVLSSEDAQALSDYLGDVAYEENLQRMGKGY